jgi:hypothetical protein
MPEDKIPLTWIGADVTLELVAAEPYPIVTRIQDITEYGIVALVLIDVPVKERRTSPMSNPTKKTLAPKFFPWHSVHSIRLLDQDEVPLPELSDLSDP